MEIVIQLDSADKQLELFGPADGHLRLLRQSLGVRIAARQSNLVITGERDKINKAAGVIRKMQDHLLRTNSLTNDDVAAFVAGSGVAHAPETAGAISVFSRKKVIKPSTKGQTKYVDTMLANDLTFCTGPAGTGKTYLAVAVAVSMLKQKQIRRMVLARPAVEAGEKLGFLPGDLQAKVNPYLRPLFDALEDMM
ncbi:MAG: PhoH family protein, partial [Planctomycetota bacterium]